MGSDFTFEDLSKENPKDYQYYRLLNETLEGKEVYVIMSAPANIDIRNRTDYSSRLLYIDKDSYNILKIEFYNEGEKEPFKTFTGEDYDVAEGDGMSERPRRATMKNHETRTTSVMTVIEARLNEDIPEDIFTVEAPRRPESEQ